MKLPESLNVRSADYFAQKVKTPNRYVLLGDDNTNGIPNDVMYPAGVTIVCPVGDVGIPVLGKSTSTEGSTIARPTICPEGDESASTNGFTTVQKKKKTLQYSGDARTCTAP